ncbi:MAG: hypothetical protein QXE45_05520 [Thermoplasmata archaeon]
MIPRHCADVGISIVDFPLTEENLRRHFLHRKSYARTKFYAVNNGGDWAVVEVTKRPTRNLMQVIESIRVLSLPERTRFLRAPDLDVLQIGQLLNMQAKYPKDLLIIQGKFDHISFVDVRLPAKIAILDVVPPRPSKLMSAIESMLGKNRSALELEVHLIDIEQLSMASKADKLILPCSSAYDDFPKRMRKQILFLDRAPALSRDDAKSVELIGCSLSGRIFEELYGTKPSLLNMCPFDFKGENIRLPTISRCCKVKNGVEVDGNRVFVPWGADICEIGEAIRIALSM